MTKFLQNGDNFNATAAMNTGRDPEVVGKVPVTLFISTSSPLPSSTSNLPHVSATNGPGGPSDPNGGGGSSGRASGHNDLPSIVGGQCANRSSWQLLETDNSDYRYSWWTCRFLHPLVPGLALDPWPASRGTTPHRTSSTFLQRSFHSIPLSTLPFCVQPRTRDG